MTKITPEHLAPRCLYLCAPVDGRPGAQQSRKPAPTVRSGRSRPCAGLDHGRGDRRRSRPVGFRDRAAGLREAACGDLRRPGRRRRLDRGVAAGAQRPRLAHAARVLRPGRHADRSTRTASTIRAIRTIGLLLGMKGTMSEMELSLFRQRSLEALKQKARRGELFLTVAIGYLKTPHDRIEKDPDRRVQEAIALVFSKFAELQTVRQVHLWMRQERLPLPAIEYGAEGRQHHLEAASLQHTASHADQPDLCRRLRLSAAPAVASRSRPGASGSCAASARSARRGRF